jgi:ABC-type phosphate/phosphonate transport system ATPase subunit
MAKKVLYSGKLHDLVEIEVSVEAGKVSVALIGDGVAGGDALVKLIPGKVDDLVWVAAREFLLKE